jgi:lipopolysaccharide transport system ATP-binding protein
MSHPAITVENLSKAYRIGRKEEIPDSLISAVQGMVRSPWKNFQRLRRLNTFRQNGESEDTIWALKDVSFEVAEGEVVGIIGRNGAGKSTLLKILSRITEPTSGRAVIRGRVSSLLEVGTGFHPELSGRENIYLNGTILGMTKREIDCKFEGIVDFSGIEKFLDTPIKRYSSGMQVRLAFSVAAHLEPEILIIDEVLAVGDAEFQKKCLGKMRDVARGGRTVLFVSHNMAVIESLCNRGVYLEGGRLVSTGQTADMVDEYRKYVLHQSECTSVKFESTRFIRRVEIFNGDGERSNVTPVGQDLRLVVTFEPERVVKYPRVLIGIDDLFGHRLVTIQPPINGNPIDRIDGALTIECIAHGFPLAPGTYLVSLTLMENREILEEIKAAETLTVVNAQVFGEGRGFAGGVCVVRSTWIKPSLPTLEQNKVV